MTPDLFPSGINVDYLIHCASPTQSVYLAEHPVETMDAIVSGFLWLLFLWSIFKKAPGIISGASMETEKMDDIDAGHKQKRRGRR